MPDRPKAIEMTDAAAKPHTVSTYAFSRCQAPWFLLCLCRKAYRYIAFRNYSLAELADFVPQYSRNRILHAPVIAGIGLHNRSILLLSHEVLSHVERMSYRHLMLLFVGLPAFLRRWTAHHELSGRDQYHLKCDAVADCEGRRFRKTDALGILCNRFVSRP